MAAHPPAKKGSSTGCWIAIAIVGGITAIAVGIMVFSFWQLSQDPDVKKALSVVSGGVELIRDAQTAEGTDELKDEGCQQPMVFDVDKLLDFAEEHNNGKKLERPDTDITHLVICQNVEEDLTCADIAEVYADAADPDDAFAVVLNHRKGSKNCSERFDSDGESLGDFASGSVPVPDIPTEE